MDATADEEAANYPQLFRQMIMRSTEAALAAVDPQADVLEDDERERSLYALSLALHLPEAWPAAKELLIDIAPSMRWQGYRDEWIDYLDKGITVAASQADWPILARLHHQLGWLYQQLNRYDQAHEHTDRAYALSVQNDDDATRIAALDQLAVIASARANYTAAQQHVAEVFRLTAGDDPRRGFGWSVLGYIALLHGEWENAIAGYTESIRLHLAVGDHRLAAQSEQGLAFVYYSAGQPEQAIAHYQLALALLANHPSVMDAAMIQMEIGLTYWHLQDYARALEMYKQSETVLVNTKSRVYLSHLYNNYGLVYGSLGLFEQAEQCFSRSIELARELAMPQLTANALDSLAQMFAAMGLPDKAITAWEQGLAELANLPEPPKQLYTDMVRHFQAMKTAQGHPAPDAPEPDSSSR